MQCDRDEVDEVICDAHVIVPLMCRLDRARLEKAKRARLIIQYGAGVEGVDAEAARDLGILLSNIPSRDTGNAESCAEMAIFLMMAALRRIRDMEESIRTRRLGVPCGTMMKGANVVIVGNGNIARALFPRLRGFGVRQCVLTRRACSELDGDPDVADWAEVADGAGSARLLGTADVVVFACSLNDESRGMMNDAFLALCKPGVIIINVARGGLLDYGATRRGLESGLDRRNGAGCAVGRADGPRGCRVQAPVRVLYAPRGWRDADELSGDGENRHPGERQGGDRGRAARRSCSTRHKSFDLPSYVLRRIPSHARAAGISSPCSGVKCVQLHPTFAIASSVSPEAGGGAARAHNRYN